MIFLQGFFSFKYNINNNSTNLKAQIDMVMKVNKEEPGLRIGPLNISWMCVSKAPSATVQISPQIADHFFCPSCIVCHYEYLEKSVFTINISYLFKWIGNFWFKSLGQAT